MLMVGSYFLLFHTVSVFEVFILIPPSPIIHILQYIPGLAFERPAQCFKCGEADRPGFAVLQYGEVCHGDAHPIGQFRHTHFPLGEHYVDIYPDCHHSTSDRQIVFGFDVYCFIQKLLQHCSKDGHHEGCEYGGHSNEDQTGCVIDFRDDIDEGQEYCIDRTD